MAGMREVQAHCSGGGWGRIGVPFAVYQHPRAVTLSRVGHRTIMKHASAMKYGGELVAAADCTYDSYLLLGTLCPECKEPVYLKSGGDRVSGKGTPYKIGPHFSHRKGTSEEQVASCETRVSNYTDKDRQRIAAKARGQRLKLIQRWFWTLVKKWGQTDSAIYNGEAEAMGIEDIESLTSTCKILIEQDTRLQSIVNALRLGLDELIKDSNEMNRFVEMFVVGLIENTSLDEDLTYRTASTLRIEIIEKHEKLLHYKIVGEVIGFLLAKQNRLSLLNDLLGFIVGAYLSRPSLDSFENRLEALDISAMSWGFFSVIATLPWASEFQRLEAESQQRKGAA